MFQKPLSVIKMSIVATMQKSLWQPRVILMTQNNAFLCTLRCSDTLSVLGVGSW